MIGEDHKRCEIVDCLEPWVAIAGNAGLEAAGLEAEPDRMLGDRASVCAEHSKLCGPAIRTPAVTLRGTIERMLAEGAVPVMACFRCRTVEACRTFEIMAESWLPDGMDGKFRCKCGAGRGWLLCFFSQAGAGEVDAGIESLREMAAGVHRGAMERAAKWSENLCAIALPCILPPLPGGFTEIRTDAAIEAVGRVSDSLAFGYERDRNELLERLRDVPIIPGYVVKLRPDFYEEIRRAPDTGLLLGFEFVACDDMPNGVSWVVEERER